MSLSVPLGLSRRRRHRRGRGCSVDYKTNGGASGFTTELTRTNRSATALDGWTLTCDHSGNQYLTNGWNGT